MTTFVPDDTLNLIAWVTLTFDEKRPPCALSVPVLPVASRRNAPGCNGPSKEEVLSYERGTPVLHHQPLGGLNPKPLTLNPQPKP